MLVFNDNIYINLNNFIRFYEYKGKLDSSLLNLVWKAELNYGVISAIIEVSMVGVFHGTKEE